MDVANNLYSINIILLGCAKQLTNHAKKKSLCSLPANTHGSGDIMFMYIQSVSHYHLTCSCLVDWSKNRSLYHKSMKLDTLLEHAQEDHFKL